MDKYLSFYSGEEENEFDCERFFVNQRPTCVLATKNAFSKVWVDENLEKRKKKKVFDIENVYGEKNGPENDIMEAKKKIHLNSIRDESLLWHNNIKLPYQKKIKKD